MMGGTQVGLLLALAISAGCSAGDTCLVCDSPARAGTVKTTALLEISGVVASSTIADLLFVHNDSSDSSRLFAMGRAGEDLGILLVDDAANEDWEDLAKGPCDTGQCLYIGDIGDNSASRSSYAIYRVPEPAAVSPGEQTVTSERIVFGYDDGQHDAEVLLVHPQTGAITIVTKADSGPASIYELPLPLVADQPYAAKKLGEVRPTEGSSRFTGGSIHPDGSGVLLRTKSRLFHFAMDAGQSAAEALMTVPCELELADETQGEAVAWLGTGDEIVTLGEGSHADINISSCQPR